MNHNKITTTHLRWVTNINCYTASHQKSPARTGNEFYSCWTDILQTRTTLLRHWLTTSTLATSGDWATTHRTKSTYDCRLTINSCSRVTLLNGWRPPSEISSYTRTAKINFSVISLDSSLWENTGANWTQQLTSHYQVKHEQHVEVLSPSQSLCSTSSIHHSRIKSSGTSTGNVLIGSVYHASYSMIFLVNLKRWTRMRSSCWER